MSSRWAAALRDSSFRLARAAKPSNSLTLLSSKSRSVFLSPKDWINAQIIPHTGIRSFRGRLGSPFSQSAGIVLNDGAFAVAAQV